MVDGNTLKARRGFPDTLTLTSTSTEEPCTYQLSTSKASPTFCIKQSGNALQCDVYRTADETTIKAGAFQVVDSKLMVQISGEKWWLVAVGEQLNFKKSETAPSDALTIIDKAAGSPAVSPSPQTGTPAPGASPRPNKPPSPGPSANPQPSPSRCNPAPAGEMCPHHVQLPETQHAAECHSSQPCQPFAAMQIPSWSSLMLVLYNSQLKMRISLHRQVFQ